ncbi:hypothetical protein BST81_16640 [Leptolyngbya sp. 'hensonii']|uniref:hypothetical protein n=1 Tax=Leptolyngbya sp. 'hensonii' TaxID=1922337 RepID=UPI00094FEED3|nr:hypothetical protein [Leptolyngbya sp. 'hensonii']OLP17419.1 hypothetical protein BST81_16640 [Leptolyngbya sp. 'hensonii']
MSDYPRVLVPKPIQKARVIRINTEDNFEQQEQATAALLNHPLVRLNQDGKPIKPKLKGMTWIIVEAIVISVVSVLITIGYSSIVGGLALLIGATGTAIHITTMARGFIPRWKAYQIALQEFKGSKKKGKKPANLIAQASETAKSKQRSRLVRAALQQTVTADGRDSDAKRGRSEAALERHLRSHFGDMIHTGLTCTIPNFPTPYTPDFALIEPISGLHLDIEIDEPYNAEGEPVHYLGLDDRRNEFFLERNWIVIRFAEEQVIRYPDACCKLIARIVADVIGAPQGSPQAIALVALEQTNPLPRVKHWTRREARAMAKRKHRGSY